MGRWKKNAVVVGTSQFLSIMGFSFALPFSPYFMQQDLGVTDPAALKMWVSFFAAATPLTLALFAPVWGHLADRFGQRLMLLRANFAGAVVVALMGTVHSVGLLVGLRLLQGMFTGTMTAAQTMVAVQTPSRRSGLLLGLLSAATFSGSMAGGFVGGLFANYFGHRAAFFVGSALLLSAGLLVLIGTREEQRPMPAGLEFAPEARTAADAAMPVIGLIGAMGFVRQFDAAMMPLLVQEIHGSIAGASLWAGSLSAVGAVAGLLSGPLLGRWADRHSPARIGKLAAAGAAALMVPQGLARIFPALFAARFGTLFCSGGLEPVFQVWLIHVTPTHRRGAVFGWAATARSAGWIIAPLAAGAVASWLGVRWVFFAGSLLYLGLIPLIGLTARRVAAHVRNGPALTAPRDHATDGGSPGGRSKLTSRHHGYT